MPKRFPKEGSDPTAQAQIEAALEDMHKGDPGFQWKDEDGSLLGCYGPLAHSSLLLPGFWQFARGGYDSRTLSPRHRELAILALSSIHKTPYIRYCHRPLFIKFGFTLEQYETGLRGEIPHGLSDEDAMVYKLGLVLTELRGPLPDDIWDEAVAAIGKQNVLGVSHIIAGYTMVSIWTNLNGPDDRWS